MTSTATPTMLTGSELYEACQAFVERNESCLSATGFESLDAGENWTAAPSLLCVAGDRTISIQHRSTSGYRDDLWEVHASDDPEAIYWGRPTRCEMLPAGVEGTGDDDWTQAIPAKLVEDIHHAVALPFLSKIYGLLNDNGIVTALVSANSYDEDTPYDLDAAIYFDVLQGYPIAPEFSTFTPQTFWDLLATGRIIDLHSILVDNGALWHVVRAGQGYLVWYPSDEVGAAHGLPVDAIYANYSEDDAGVLPILDRPAIAELKAMAEEDAVDLTNSLKRTLAYAEMDYAEQNRQMNELDNT